MFRENIYDVIKKTGENVSALVIPKNSGLRGYAEEVLKDAGLDLKKARLVSKNKLRLDDLTIILKRGEDIPQTVVDAARRGEFVLGITGDDLYDEYRLREPGSILQIENTYDWFDENARYLRPALCLINKSGCAKDIPLEAKIAINAKYPYTSRDYLDKSPNVAGRKFIQTQYWGDVELTVSEGTHDCAIDIVYSGETLERNSLSVADIVRFSDLVVISPLRKEDDMFARALRKEYMELTQRLQYPTDSFTSKMLQEIDIIASKGAEEWGELIKALKKESDLAMLGELADVQYVIMAMMVKRGIPLDTLAEEMLRRQR